MVRGTCLLPTERAEAYGLSQRGCETPALDHNRPQECKTPTRFSTPGEADQIGQILDRPSNAAALCHAPSLGRHTLALPKLPADMPKRPMRTFGLSHASPKADVTFNIGRHRPRARARAGMPCRAGELQPEARRRSWLCERRSRAQRTPRSASRIRHRHLFSEACSWLPCSKPCARATLVPLFYLRKASAQGCAGARSKKQGMARNASVWERRRSGRRCGSSPATGQESRSRAPRHASRTWSAHTSCAPRNLRNRWASPRCGTNVVLITERKMNADARIAACTHDGP